MEKTVEEEEAPASATASSSSATSSSLAAADDGQPPPAKRIKREAPNEIVVKTELSPAPKACEVIVELAGSAVVETNGGSDHRCESARGYRFEGNDAMMAPFTMYDPIFGALRVAPLLDPPRFTVRGLVRSREGGLPLWTQIHLRAGARAVMWLEVDRGSKLADLCNEAHAANAIVAVQSCPRTHSDAFEICLVPRPPRRKRPDVQTEEQAQGAVKTEAGVVKTEEQTQDVVKTEAGASEEDGAEQGTAGFLVYAVPVGSLGEALVPDHTNGTTGRATPSRLGGGLLSHAQIGLVCGVEHTLACIFDLTHAKPPRETELAMLQEFDQSQHVSLAGGTQIVAQMEETWLDEMAHQEDALIPAEALGETENGNSPAADPSFDKEHPVIRLSSAEGELVLTKIACGPKGSFMRSILVHIRPGWPELRRYILNQTAAAVNPQQQQEQQKQQQPADGSAAKDGEGGSSSSDASSTSASSAPASSLLFRVFACCKQARSRREALELWRLLDPDGELLVDTGGAERARGRVYSHPTAPERSIDAALESYPSEHQVSMAVDNSTRWFGRSGLAKVWPVRPYEPYSGNQDTGLSGVLHAIHAIRNMFYERCDVLTHELSAWSRQLEGEGGPSRSLESYLRAPQPSAPVLMQLVQFQKHRWLQEFQAPQTRGVPRELAAAKDFADPILRNKWHLVVDTNVLHHCASDNFEFFRTLEHTHSDSIVMVIPFATVHELDWQKHHVKDPVKLANATASIRYLNSQVSAGSRFIVMQSVSEDAPHAAKHKHVKPFNAQNDMRVFECANSRMAAGMRTLVLSGDTNLRNVCISANVPAVRFQPLWGMLNSAKYQRLSPEHWLRALQKIEHDKRARQQKRHANQRSLGA